MIKTRIAVICQNDTLWSLYAWNKALPLLLKSSAEYDIVGFWVCDEKFINIKPQDAWKWYLKTFRLGNFLLLALFAIVFKIVCFFKSIIAGYKTSFKELCKANQVAYHTIASPNALEFTNWIKTNKVDVLVIMVGHILKGEILNAPTNCIINKHAAMLPSNKGVFPYFWAFIKQEAQGITFHKVTSKIDEGDILFQEEVADEKWLTSMISFYFYTYKNYGALLMHSLSNVLTNKTMSPPSTIQSSYCGAPKPEDYTRFNDKGGKIIRLRDLFLPLGL
jgi:hypothetical protein